MPGAAPNASAASSRASVSPRTPASARRRRTADCNGVPSGRIASPPCSASDAQCPMLSVSPAVSDHQAAARASGGVAATSSGVNGASQRVTVAVRPRLRYPGAWHQISAAIRSMSSAARAWWRAPSMSPCCSHHTLARECSAVSIAGSRRWSSPWSRSRKRWW